MEIELKIIKKMSYRYNDYPDTYEWIEEIAESDEYIRLFEDNYPFTEEELIHILFYFCAAQYDMKWCDMVLSKLSDDQIIRLIEKDWGIDCEFVFTGVPFIRARRIAKKIDSIKAYLMLWFKITENIHVIRYIRQWRQRYSLRSKSQNTL